MALRGSPGAGGSFRRPPAGCVRDESVVSLDNSRGVGRGAADLVLARFALPFPTRFQVPRRVTSQRTSGRAPAGRVFRSVSLGAPTRLRRTTEPGGGVGKQVGLGDVGAEGERLQRLHCLPQPADVRLVVGLVLPDRVAADEGPQLKRSVLQARVAAPAPERHARFSRRSAFYQRAGRVYLDALTSMHSALMFWARADSRQTLRRCGTQE